MTSDILILFKESVNKQDASKICAAIYKVTKTAVISFDPARGKMLQVKFDPASDVPIEILNAVRATGQDAVMAGG